MLTLTTRLRRFTATLSTAALMLAAWAGPWMHQAEAALAAEAPCHGQVAEAAIPACEAICKAVTISDVAPTTPVFQGKVIAVVAPEFARALRPARYLHAIPSLHDRPPRPHPLAITSRLLI